MADNEDIIQLLSSLPWEQRNDPSTARKIAELIAAKAAQKMAGSVAFQEQSVELNEKMFNPPVNEQADRGQQGPSGMQPAPPDTAGNPNIGELM